MNCELLIFIINKDKFSLVFFLLPTKNDELTKTRYFAR